MQKEATVFVVDDDTGVRNSVEVLLKSVGLPVQTFASAQQFIGAFTDDVPGCVVLDIRMPGMSGLELQRHLRDRGCAIPVIIVTGHGDVPIAVKAMKDGASEFLEKPYSIQLLLEHVQAALERDRKRWEEQKERDDAVQRLGLLTRREHEVVQLIVAGKMSKEAAMALGISKKTVDVHRARVMHKLQVGSVAELVRVCMRAGETAGAPVPSPQTGPLRIGTGAALASGPQAGREFTTI